MKIVVSKFSQRTSAKDVPVRIRLWLLSIPLFALLLINSGCQQAQPSHAASSPASSPATASADHSGHGSSQVIGQTDTATITRTEATPPQDKVPHYFDDPNRAKPFPVTMDPSKFSDKAAQMAYAAARRIPEVLAQQPCYCWCDEGFGHGSLLHCHIDSHSAG
jgi:hypothetical protein